MSDEGLFIPEDDSEFTEDGRRHLFLHDVKVKGDTWHFNLNDKDPFPCENHAHNSNGDKLDPNTGEIFDKNRNLIGNMGHKKLKYIQNYLSSTHHHISE